MDSLLTLWSANTAVSATVWLLLAMTLLYFGRRSCEPRRSVEFGFWGDFFT